MDKVKEFSGGRRNYARVGRLMAVLLIGASLAACTVAAATPDATPTESPAAPSTSPWPSETATATNMPEPSASPTPTAPKGPLPSVGPVPSGNWTGLSWIALPAGYAPTGQPAPGSDASLHHFVDLFGWSGGYVDFVWDGQHSVVPWASADGLRWKAGPALPPGDFLPTTPAGATWCDFEIDSFVEAPAGLLASGGFVCHSGECGLGASAFRATWVSHDGLVWSLAADVPNGQLSVGSAGYVVTDGHSVWTSADARTWNQGAAPTVALAKDEHWGEAVSFDAGFVITSVTSACMTPAGTMASVFWSADGSAWTRVDPPGAKNGKGVWVDTQIDKVSDQLLLLREFSYDQAAKSQSFTVWTSKDGRTWTQLISWTCAVGVVDLRLNHLVQRGILPPDGDVLTNGSAFVVTHYDEGNLTVYDSFDAGHKNLIQLSEKGDLPNLEPCGRNVALGPAGLLVTDYETRFWLGVPTAG